ncbi:MAG: adhesin transport system outer membrane protein [Hyphomicrobiaceae bacterium]|jgi:adhesin transport system outer membrane protein
MKCVLAVRLPLFRIALAAIFVGSTYSVACASALTLREAVQLTLDGNPLIRVATANRRATDYELRQSQSRFLPNVSLDGDVGRQRIDRPLGFSEDVNNIWRTRRQVAVTVRQVLFDGWEIANAVYRNAARVDSAALRVMSRSEALALSAIEAFVDVHRQRQVLIVARRNVTRHRRYLQQVQTKKTGGKTGIGEVQQVRERLTAAASAVLRIQQSLANAISKFNRVVGIRPHHLVRPASPRGLPKTRQAAVNLSIRNNPAILAANADIEAAQHATDGSRSAYFPKLSAEFKRSYGKHLDGTPGPSTDSTGKLVLSWSLFSGGIRSARTNELAERAAEAMAQRDAQVREAVEQVDRAFAAVQIGSQQLRTSREQAQLALRVVKTYNEEFRLSKRSLLDLLDSERARYDADITLIGARSLLLFAQYQMLGATGTLIRNFGARVSDATIANRRESVARSGALFSVALPPLSK